jgi:hypothetical protein
LLLQHVSPEPSRALIERLAAALPTSQHESQQWALLVVLAPLAKRGRLEPSERARLAQAFAELCVRSANEGHWRWADESIGRSELVAALKPALRSCLRRWPRTPPACVRFFASDLVE